MTPYKPSLDRFRRFLDERQRAELDAFDPKVLRDSLRDRIVGVGYKDDTLQRRYGANLRRLFPRAVAMNDRRWRDCEAFLGTGTVRETADQSHPGMERIFESDPGGRPVVLFEQGFVASVASWTHSFETGRLEYACLSYVLDDIAHYFMANYPNRLIHKLNGSEEITKEQRARARRLIDRLRAEQISKYNAQPVVQLPATDRPRVLVCDQTYADASTVYGLADDPAFEDMLAVAVQENPGAEILVKTHPDTLETAEKERKRTGFYAGMRSHDNVRVVTEPMNPMALMEQVDRVYVGTSGMGMDALIAGKDVVVFGAPFFAGWGVTDDRREVPHRHRTRTVEDLFHYFYVWYTHYTTPETKGPCEIEDAIDYIVAHRGALRQPSAHPTSSPSPRVSVIIPMHNVEDYIEPCVRSVLDQTLRELEVLVVDDQSPDRSRTIVEAIAAEDPRVRVISMSENVGQGFARNAGLDEARGEYVWFIDSDDLMGREDALQRLVVAADVDAADIVRARKHIRDERGPKVVRRVDPVEASFPDEDSGLDLVSRPELLRNNHFWNFLYRREFLEEHGIRFELAQWEERPFLLHALLEASRITTTDVVGTIYRMRKGSTARRKKTEVDVQRRQENIRLCLAHLRRHGANDEASPLYPHYRFCASRSLALLFSGFQRDFLLEHDDPSERARLYDDIAVILDGFGIDAEALVEDPDQVDHGKFEVGYYALVYEACRAREHALLDVLVREEELSQRQAYALLARYAGTPVGRALNRYIRGVPPAIERSKKSVTPSEGDASRKPVVFLHVGSTKTGSTYIQHFCDLNRGALLARGIYYPEFGIFSQEGRPHKTAGHALFLPDSLDPLRPPLLHRLLAAIDAAPTPVKTVILSSEAIFLANDPTRLATYLAPHFDVRVVVYLRRQDDWANSQYAEFVGGGAMNRISDTPQAWIRSEKVRKLLDYAGKVDRWATVLDDADIVVRPYERSRWRDGDLLSDFCEVVGIPSDGPWERPGRDRANEMPLGTAHLMVLRHWNQMPFASDVEYLAFVEEVWRGLRQEGASASRVELLGRDLRAEVSAAAEGGNRYVAQRYLGREDGVLFEDLSPPAIETDPNPKIAVSELQVILRAYLNHAPARPPEGAAVATPGLAARIGRKLRKLLRDPAGFLRDAKSPLLRRMARLWSRDGSSRGRG